MDLCENCKNSLSPHTLERIKKEVEEFKIKYLCFHRYQQIKNKNKK